MTTPSITTKLSTLVLLCIGYSPHVAYGQDASLAGLWKLKSSGGYEGSVALDAVGGCSYYISSAMLSIQATCIVRELSDGTVLVFGTQEGTNIAAPTYGDQAGNQVVSSAVSTNLSILLTKIEPMVMTGQLITAGASEEVRLTR